MNWYYWKAHHGLPYDTKIALIAKRLNIHRTRVLSVWVACLDYASQHENRGSIEGLDVCEVALGLDLETSEVEAIMQAFRLRGMVVGDMLSAWEKRNDKKEDRTAADRKRRQREREKAQCHGSHGVTGRDGHGSDGVTVTGAERDSHTEERRGEEIRKEAAHSTNSVEAAAALKSHIKLVSQSKDLGKRKPPAAAYTEVRNWLMAYPGADRLPGEPDDDIVAKCLALAGNDVGRASAALRAMNSAGKRANTSWAYFPRVMAQYLEAC